MSLPSHPMVIRRRELAATLDATAVMAGAKVTAATERKKARDAGFREGVNAGMQLARVMTTQLTATIQDYWAAREDELVEVCLALTHRVVADLPGDDVLRGLARRALLDHRHDAAPVLRVSPDVASALSRDVLEPAETARLEIRTESALPPGSLILEHARGQTEISLLAQFRALLDQVRRP